MGSLVWDGVEQQFRRRGDDETGCRCGRVVALSFQGQQNQEAQGRWKGSEQRHAGCGGKVTNSRPAEEGWHRRTRPSKANKRRTEAVLH